MYTIAPSLYNWASELVTRLIGAVYLDFNYRCSTLNAPEPVRRVKVPALRKGTAVRKGGA
jgi:hypothetical protein